MAERLLSIIGNFLCRRCYLPLAKEPGAYCASCAALQSKETGNG